MRVIVNGINIETDIAEAQISKISELKEVIEKASSLIGELTEGKGKIIIEIED